MIKYTIHKNIKFRRIIYTSKSEYMFYDLNPLHFIGVYPWIRVLWKKHIELPI